MALVTGVQTCALPIPRFSALVCAQKACRILDSSETFDAAQAHGMGFATQVSEQADWPEILRMALDTSRSLNPVARGMLYEALADHDYDRDMALLIRSLSVPGLKERIQGYLA